jgi:integrase
LRSLLARAFCATLESRPATITKKAAITTAIRDYHRWSDLVKHKGRSQMVQQTYTLGIFLRFADEAGLRSIDNLSTETARDFMAWYFKNYPFHANARARERRSDGTATWEQYRQVLHAFCAWLIRRELLAGANPFADQELKIKRQAKLPRILDRAEIQKLLAFWDKRADDPMKLAVFFRFLLYTGCRLSEARDLRRRDVTKGLIHINRSKSKGVRTIPVAGQLQSFLALLSGKPDDYLFPRYDQGRYWKELRRATDALDIRNVRVHDFRHTFAASLAMQGVQIVAIQRLLGHSDIRMTTVYTHFYPEHLQSAVDLLKF